ncbi:MAG: hypothetical protein FWE36_01880 [Erysipelotrichales bacterium]|nr:hypothetical protein [Erysipelotrichales bacterium]
MKFDTNASETTSLLNNRNQFRTGDVLTASALNELVIKLLEASDRVSNLFGFELTEVFKHGIHVDWTRSVDGTLQSTEIIVPLGSFPVWVPTTGSSARVKFESRIEGRNLFITVTEQLDLHNDKTVVAEIYFTFPLRFYTDSTESRLITQSFINFTYECPSTQPID